MMDIAADMLDARDRGDEQQMTKTMDELVQNVNDGEAAELDEQEAYYSIGGHGHQDKSPVKLFVESVVKGNNTKDKKKMQIGVRMDEIVGYRFVFCVMNSRVNPNHILEELIQENEDYMTKSKANKQQANPAGKTRSYMQTNANTKPLQSFEEWRNITNKKIWTDAASAYVNTNTIIENAQVVEYEPIRSGANPASFLNVFNPFFMNLNTPARVAPPQDARNVGKYFRKNDKDMWEVRFPMRKYVFRVPMTEMSVQHLHKRMLPEVEKYGYLQVCRDITRLIAENQAEHGEEQEINSFDDIIDVGTVNADLDKEEDDTEIVDTSWKGVGLAPPEDEVIVSSTKKQRTGLGGAYALTASSSSSSTALRGLAPDLLGTEPPPKFAYDDVVAKHEVIDGAFSNLQAMDLEPLVQTTSPLLQPRTSVRGEAEVSIDGGDTEEEPPQADRKPLDIIPVDIPINGMTRRKRLKELAARMGVVGFDVHRVTGFQKEKLASPKSLQAAGLILNSPSTMQMCSYTSSLARAREQTEQNIGFIDRHILNPDSPLGKKLVNPYYVARKLLLMHKEVALQWHQQWMASEELSPCQELIRDAVSKDGLYINHNVMHEKFDDSLSSFANNEIRHYIFLEQIYLLNFTHREASVAKRFSLDAYNMNFHKIHNHMIAQSNKGGKGKSHVWTLLQNEWRIPGTVVMINYQSTRANASDQENMNGQVIIMDEVEKELLDQNAKSDKERSLKDLLSNNKMVIKTLIIESDGKRYTKFTYSQCISVYLGSTNMDLSCMSHAMRRRFYITHYDGREASNRHLIELEMVERMLQPKEKALRRELNKQEWRMQAMVFEVESMIHHGFLHDVNMVVTMIILVQVVTSILGKGFREPEPSMVKRIVSHARILCIQDCIDRVFFNTGGKANRKNFIDTKDFTALDRMLFTTVEHTIAAIAEMIDILVDPTETALKAVFVELFAKNTQGAQFKKLRAYRYQIDKTDHNIVRAQWTEATDGNYIKFPIKPSFATFVSKIECVFGEMKAKAQIPLTEAERLAGVQRFSDVCTIPNSQQIRNTIEAWAGLTLKSGPWVNYDILMEQVSSIDAEIKMLTTRVSEMELKEKDASGTLLVNLVTSGEREEYEGTIQEKKTKQKQHYRPHNSNADDDVEGEAAMAEEADAGQDMDVDEREQEEPTTTKQKRRYLDRDEKTETAIASMRDLHIANAGSDIAAFSSIIPELKASIKIKQGLRNKLNNLKDNLPAGMLIEDKSVPPEVQKVAQYDEYNVYIHTKWIMDKTSSIAADVVKEIIVDMLECKHQLPGRYLWMPNIRTPHVREILETRGGDEDAPLMPLPMSSVVSAAERRIMGRQAEGCISAFRQSDTGFVDQDLDVFGMNARNKELYIVNDRYDTELKKQQEMIATGRVDASKLPSLYRTYHVAPVTLKINLFQTEDSCVLGYQNDDDYDTKPCGYFLGDPLDDLFADVKTMLANLSDQIKEKLFTDMDLYVRTLTEDPDDFRHIYDVDFDPEEYVLFNVHEDKEVAHKAKLEHQEKYGTPPRKKYHWDVLGNFEDEDDEVQKALTQLRKNQGKRMRPDALKREEQKLELETRRAVFARNVEKYKIMCCHPFYISDLENMRYYDDEKYNKTRYPHCLPTAMRKTREERWADLKELSLDEGRLAAAVQRGELHLQTYELKNGKLVRNKNHPGALTSEAMTPQMLAKKRAQLSGTNRLPKNVATKEQLLARSKHMLSRASELNMNAHLMAGALGHVPQFSVSGNAFQPSPPPSPHYTGGAKSHHKDAAPLTESDGDEKKYTYEQLIKKKTFAPVPGHNQSPEDSVYGQKRRDLYAREQQSRDAFDKMASNSSEDDAMMVSGMRSMIDRATMETKPKKTKSKHKKRETREPETFLTRLQPLEI